MAGGVGKVEGWEDWVRYEDVNGEEMTCLCRVPGKWPVRWTVKCAFEVPL